MRRRTAAFIAALACHASGMAVACFSGWGETWAMLFIAGLAFNVMICVE